MFYLTVLIDFVLVLYAIVKSIILEIFYFFTRSRPQKEIKNSHILITGSGQGLGRMLVERLAKDGNTLHLVDINDLLNERTKVEFGGGNCTIHTYHCDVSNIESVVKLYHDVQRNSTHVSYIFNNAGMTIGKLFNQTTSQQYSKVISVNLLGMMHITKVFLDDMIERGGHLVYISSVAGLCGGPFLCDYSASKHGVTGFIRGLPYDLAYQNIRNVKVTGIFPNFMDTGMFHGATVKFPRLFPILKPSSVADEVITATKEEREELILPRSSNIFLPCIFLYTPRVFRRLCKFLGNELMTTFEQTRHYNY